MQLVHAMPKYSFHMNRIRETGTIHLRPRCHSVCGFHERRPATQTARLSLHAVTKQS